MREWHHSALQTHHLEIAGNADVAKKATRNGCGVARHADDSGAAAGKALHADRLIRNSNHAFAHDRLAHNAAV